MRPYRRNWMLLIAIVFSGIVFYSITYGRFMQLQAVDESEIPFELDSRLGRKLLTFREGEGIGDLNDYTSPSIIKSSMQSLENLKTEESTINPVSRVNSMRKGFRRHTRRKRDTPKEKSPTTWQFKVNVTSIGNQNASSPHKAGSTSDERGSEIPGQYLGVALHVEGNGPEDSYSEMHRAWDSVENFLKNLFGGNIEELSERGHGVFVDLNGLPSKILTGEPLTKEELTAAKKFQSRPKDKEGKLLFGLFGQGGNSENPPIDQGSGEAFDHTNFVHPTSIKDAKSPDNIPTIESPVAMNFPVDEMENSTLISATLNNPALKQQLEKPVTLEEVEDRDGVLKDESIDDNSRMFSTPLAEFPTPFVKQLESTENEGEVLNHRNELKVAADSRMSETSTIETRNGNVAGDSFSTEEFKEFCISMLQKVLKSPRLLEDLSDMEGSGSVGLEENEANAVEATSHDQVSTESIGQQIPQNLGFFASILNRITGGRFRQESSTVKLLNNISVELETDNRKARIFNFNNLFENFGSGRSAESNEFENIKFDDIDLNASLNTVRDVFSECEMFFRRIQEKNPPTISNVLNPEIQMKHEQNREDNLSLMDETTESHAIEDSQDVQGKMRGDARNLLLEDAEKRNSFDSVSTMKNPLSETGSEQTSDKEDRIFNELEFGSGLKIEPRSSKEKENRIFGFFTGGSGEREVSEVLLNDPDTDNHLTSTVISQEHRIFPGILNLGSGDRNFEESFQFETETSTGDVTTDKNEQILGFGRDEKPMQEKLESTRIDFTTSEILPFQNSRELHIHDTTIETNLDFTNEIDNKIVTSSVGMQTQLSKEERRILSNSLASQDALSVTETYEEKRRFNGFLNIGSGDGRELETNENFVSGGRIQPDCIVCTLENGTETSIRCTECSLENLTEIPSKVDSRSSVLETSSNIALSNDESFTALGLINVPENPSQIYESNGNAVRAREKIHSIPSSTDGTVIATSENRMEGNESLLIGKLFLSGNEESTDQINLVHETESTSASTSSFSPRNARRGRVLDQIPFAEQEEKSERHLEGTNALGETSIAEDFPETFNDVGTVTPNGLGTFSIDPTFAEMLPKAEQNSSQIEVHGLLSALQSEQNNTEQEEGSKLPLSTTMTTTAIYDHRRKIESKERFCANAEQCNVFLNERCVSRGNEAVCDCGKKFVRHSVTRKCEVPVLVKISIGFPDEDFHEDLKNESTELFQEKRNDSINMIKLVLSPNPELLAALIKVEITEFLEGSLIVYANLVFAKEQNASITEIVDQVHFSLIEAFKDEALLRRAPLNSNHAHPLLISAVINRCEKKELNYCSSNANCIPDGHNFKCECKDGYLDNSREEYAGESCIEICTPSYCGNNGHCKMKPTGEKYCLCSGWYFGDKCQVPGLVVIGGFAGSNVLVLLVIFGIICFCRRRRQRSRFYGSENRSEVQPNETLSAVPSRIMDTIAMNEMGAARTSKYVARSTPARGIPIINVSSPSIMGSSMSYDFDSTFDRSVNVEEENISERL